MILPCPHCNGLNRLPADKPMLDARCGKCKQPLFQGQPLELTKANFAAHAQKAELPLVVDFWASWSGPCQSLAPVFSEGMIRESPKRLTSVKKTKSQYGVLASETDIKRKSAKEREITTNPHCTKQKTW